MCKPGEGKCGIGGNEKFSMPTNVKLIENTICKTIKDKIGQNKYEKLFN